MTVEELRNDARYECWLTLRHHEILPFVQEEFSQHSPLLRFYIYLNVLLLVLMIGLGAWQAYQGMITVGKIIQYSSLGMVLVLTLLVPVHEGIHGLAYKLIGAPKVKFGSDIRKFIFYAMADHFVVGPGHFRFVALAPFGIINFFAFFALFFVSLPYQWLLLGVLLMHLGACAGDFAMLSFFYRHRREEVYTYDDVAGQVSYFYRLRQA